MESLVRLINCLRPSEVQFIKDFYKTRSCAEKRLKLFKLITTGKIRDHAEAIKKIYPDKKSSPASAFSHLKKKLQEDILNIITIISSDTDGSEEDHQELVCRKLLMQGEILLSRGVRQEGLSLLEKTSRLAERYEFPDIDIASCNILRKHDHKLSFQQYNHRLERSLDNYRDLLRAQEAYFYRERSGHLPAHLARPGSGQSKKVHYWHELAFIEELCRQYEFGRARETALDLLDFLRYKNTICSREKEARVLNILARILVHLGEYKAAASFAQKAYERAVPGSAEKHAMLTVLFFTHFRTENFAQAQIVYEMAIDHDTTNECARNQWTLLMAALNFSQKDYKSVNRTLARWDIKLCKDPNWSLSPRLLEILTILELKDYDWYEYRCECFRKKLARFKSGVQERLKLVFSLLFALIKANFDYDLMLMREQQSLERLETSSSGLYWDPMGYELINIPQWILKKAGKPILLR